MSAHVVTDADDGSRIEVRVGDVLQVRLPDNPTTGYRWVLVPPDEELLVVQDASYVSCDDRVGSGGTAAWSLLATGPGTAQVRASRMRPWEGEASVIRRFDLVVEVTAAR
jgi:inhibitor of cysteine peptidase